MLLTLLLLACSTGTEVGAEAPVEVFGHRIALADPVDTLTLTRSALLARHVEDLPTSQRLGPDAVDALMTLATTDDLLLVRRRALVLLAEYPSGKTADFCLGLAHDDDPQVRTGATACLGGQDLTVPEVKELLLDAVYDEDVRVGIAAAKGLGRSAEGRALLARIDEQGLPELTRERVLLERGR